MPCTSYPTDDVPKLGHKGFLGEGPWDPSSSCVHFLCLKVPLLLLLLPHSRFYLIFTPSLYMGCAFT
jgi:hypothetical protein